jgi:hypothetical protein
VPAPVAPSPVAPSPVAPSPAPINCGCDPFGACPSVNTAFCCSFCGCICTGPGGTCVGC